MAWALFFVESETDPPAWSLPTLATQHRNDPPHSSDQEFLGASKPFENYSLPETNISHLGKRNSIFQSVLEWKWMEYVSSQESEYQSKWESSSVVNIL